MVLTAPDINALIAAALNGTDGVHSGHEIQFWSGSPPGNIQSAATGNLLATISLGSDWGTFNGTSLVEADNPHDTTADQAGQPGYYRLIAWDGSADVALQQGSVGAQGSGADIQFNNLDWPSGLPITLDAFSIQLPRVSQS